MMSKRTINAKEVVKDIRAGMDDKGLMKKYALSTQWIPILFKRLVDSGLLDQADLDRRAATFEWSALVDSRDLGHVEDSEAAGEFEKTVDLSELYPRSALTEPSLMVETRELTEPTETVNLSKFVQQRPLETHEVQETEKMAASAPAETRDLIITEETIKALCEFADWWTRSKTAMPFVVTGERPTFKSADVATRTIRISAHLLKAAEEKARKEASRTGGTLDSLVEVLLWEFLGRPEQVIEPKGKQ